MPIHIVGVGLLFVCHKAVEGLFCSKLFILPPAPFHGSFPWDVEKINAIPHHLF